MAWKEILSKAEWKQKSGVETKKVIDRVLNFTGRVMRIQKVNCLSVFENDELKQRW
jgi:hypothetical protein